MFLGGRFLGGRCRTVGYRTVSAAEMWGGGALWGSPPSSLFPPPFTLSLSPAVQLRTAEGPQRAVLGPGPTTATVDTVPYGSAQYRTVPYGTVRYRRVP